MRVGGGVVGGCSQVLLAVWSNVNGIRGLGEKVDDKERGWRESITGTFRRVEEGENDKARPVEQGWRRGLLEEGIVAVRN